MFVICEFWASLTLIHSAPRVVNGTANFFAFSLIIEGTTEKVLKLIMPLKSIYNRNFF